ncbi:MAG: hypothetical protein ACYS83_08200 [Planctomycetota bacterium]
MDFGLDPGPEDPCLRIAGAGVDVITDSALEPGPALLRPAAKPDACVVGQKRSQRGENHASEHFWPAALASHFSLDLITTRLFG